MMALPAIALLATADYRNVLGLLTALCIFAIFKLYHRQPRMPPNLSILKISTLPGKKGEAADINAYIENGSDVMRQGYKQVRCSHSSVVTALSAYFTAARPTASDKLRQYSRKGRNFLMRTPSGLVFVAAPRFIDEIRNVTESVLSAMAINNATLQVKYTLHPILNYDWYEFEVVSKQLTQSLGMSSALYPSRYLRETEFLLGPGLPDMVDECHKAFLHEMGTPAGRQRILLSVFEVLRNANSHHLEWTKKHTWPVACRVVTRTANRQLFGERLAENMEFLQLSTDITYTVFNGAHAIRGYPGFLRPFILRWKTDIAGQKAIARKHLVPLFEDRIRKMQEAIKTGNVADYERGKHNDAGILPMLHDTIW